MGLAVSTKSRLEEPAYSRQATASLHKAIPLSRRRLKRKATKLFLGHRQPSPVPRGVATSQPTLGSGILTRFPFGGMFSSNQRREKRTRGSKERKKGGLRSQFAHPDHRPRHREKPRQNTRNTNNSRVTPTATSIPAFPLGLTPAPQPMTQATTPTTPPFSHTPRHPLAHSPTPKSNKTNII